MIEALNGIDAPRVLFVTSAAFNRVTGGGITFSNLFRGWPADRLATVHSDPVPVTDDVCRRFYKLGPDELGRWPRGLLAASPPGSSSSPASTPAAPGILRRAKSLVIGNAWPDHGTVSSALARWIAEFQPTVLYTILGTIGMMELVQDIRRRFDVELVVHFMDDWPATLYRGGLMAPLLRRHMERLIGTLVGNAAVRLGISDAMCDAYGKRYGGSFVSVQNPINDATQHVSWTARPAGKPAQLVYVGSIFDNAQLDSIVDIARAVTRLNTRGQNVVFNIYSPKHLAERFRHRIEIDPAIRLHDTITNDEAFFNRISLADALVLPVNFDAGSVDFIRYSMPTKVPAYLAAGAPILVYGPAQTAQVRYAMTEKWGLVVTKRDETALDETLLRILFDDESRAGVVAAARDAGRRNHDPEIVRTRFQNALTSAGRG